jgi:hypothetical protein
MHAPRPGDWHRCHGPGVRVRRAAESIQNSKWAVMIFSFCEPVSGLLTDSGADSWLTDWGNWFSMWRQARPLQSGPRARVTMTRTAWAFPRRAAPGLFRPYKAAGEGGLALTLAARVTLTVGRRQRVPSTFPQRPAPGPSQLKLQATTHCPAITQAVRPSLRGLGVDSSDSMCIYLIVSWLYLNVFCIYVYVCAQPP